MLMEREGQHTKNSNSVSSAQNIQIIKKPQSRIHKSNLSQATKELSRIEINQNLLAQTNQLQPSNNKTDKSARNNTQNITSSKL